MRGRRKLVYQYDHLRTSENVCLSVLFLSVGLSQAGTTLVFTIQFLTFNG